MWGDASHEFEFSCFCFICLINEVHVHASLLINVSTYSCMDGSALFLLSYMKRKMSKNCVCCLELFQMKFKLCFVLAHRLELSVIPKCTAVTLYHKVCERVSTDELEPYVRTYINNGSLTCFFVAYRNVLLVFSR